MPCVRAGVWVCVRENIARGEEREREKDIRKFGLSDRRGRGRGREVEKRKEGEKIETGCGMRYLPVRVIPREYIFSLFRFPLVSNTYNICNARAGKATTHPEDRPD